MLPASSGLDSASYGTISMYIYYCGKQIQMGNNGDGICLHLLRKQLSLSGHLWLEFAAFPVLTRSAGAY